MKNKLDMPTHVIEGWERAINRFQKVADEADAAMKRFTAKLRKELSKNGKSKQGKGKSV